MTLVKAVEAFYLHMSDINVVELDVGYWLK